MICMLMYAHLRPMFVDLGAFVLVSFQGFGVGGCFGVCETVARWFYVQKTTFHTFQQFSRFVSQGNGSVALLLS